MSKQDTSLEELDNELGYWLEWLPIERIELTDITQDEWRVLKKAILAWHSTQQKALLKRVREEVIGEDIELIKAGRQTGKGGSPAAVEHALSLAYLRAEMRQKLDNLMEELR